MDALKQEIERKRKEREEAAGAGGVAPAGPKKWLKRGDVERLREEKYYADEARESKEREGRLVVPCLQRYDTGTDEAPAADANAGASAAASGGAPQGASAGAPDGSGGKELLDVEVKRLLRNLGQPIQLYGEDGAERLERYRNVSATLPSVNEENLELKKGQMFNESQLYDESGKAKQEGVQADNEGEAAAASIDADEFEGGFLHSTPQQLVTRQFKTLIKLWETTLNQRPEGLQRSVDGKRETAAYLQCRRHMKPFFKQLKHKTMPDDVLDTMIKITESMIKREYVQAHDAYIQCAIGNAPWPIGVSQTGVHDRQGRQHIRESKLAHVMNDETQRKYLQGVKRLMTFAQRALPPVGPSKAVL